MTMTTLADSGHNTANLRQNRNVTFPREAFLTFVKKKLPPFTAT